MKVKLMGQWIDYQCGLHASICTRVRRWSAAMLFGFMLWLLSTCRSFAADFRWSGPQQLQECHTQRHTTHKAAERLFLVSSNSKFFSEKIFLIILFPFFPFHNNFKILFEKVNLWINQWDAGLHHQRLSTTTPTNATSNNFSCSSRGPITIAMGASQREWEEWFVAASTVKSKWRRQWVGYGQNQNTADYRWRRTIVNSKQFCPFCDLMRINASLTSELRRNYEQSLVTHSFHNYHW